MKILKLTAVISLIVLCVLIFSCLFVVREGQQAILLRLGKIMVNDQGTSTVYNPGIHFKLPVINSALTFDMRTQVLLWDTAQRPMLTSQKTFLVGGIYVAWRINNPSLYYKRTGGSLIRTEQLIQTKISAIVRAQFGKHTSNAIISTDREAILVKVKQIADKNISKEYGVHIVDVRLNSIKLPEKIMTSVFKRMASERTQFAAYKRANGKSGAAAIRGNADKEVVVISATAEKNAALLKAQGDEQAAKIYADAYQKNVTFFAFYKSLQAYQQVFSQKGDVLVLRPDSEFFEYFDPQQAGKNNKAS